MSELPDERQLVLNARSRLDAWTTEARSQAYTELFGGDDPSLTSDELRLLDAIDSELARRGEGVWGTDQYGIRVTDADNAASMSVVCVFHPQITADSVLRGDDGVDDETEERLNAALWQYAERVATLVEAELDEFVRRTRG